MFHFVSSPVLISLFFCVGLWPLQGQTWRTINSGLWSDPANWGGTLPTNDGTADLIFSAVGDPIKVPGDTHMDLDWDIRSIYWNPTSLRRNEAYIRKPFSGTTLTLRNGLNNQSGGRVEIHPDIVLPTMQEWNDAGVSTSVFGTITGSGGILKTGSGTLVLGAPANSYTGGNIISGGVLAVRVPAALGAVSSTIQIDDAILRIMTDGAADLAHNLNLGPGTAVIQAREITLTVSGVISGGGMLRLEPDSSFFGGPPRYVLSNANSYTGGTEVERVTLRTVGTNQSLGFGSVTLKEGSVLRLTASSNLAPNQKVAMHPGSTFVLTSLAIDPYVIIEKDPTKTTGGTLALTSATSGLSLDMAAIGNGALFLGSSENIAYTGTLGPGAGGVYRIGGGSGDVIYSPTLTFGGRENVFTGANSIVFGTNSGLNFPTEARNNSTILLTRANDYSGGTILGGGTLVVGDDGALGSGVLTFTGGRLSTSGGPRTLSNPVLFQESILATLGELTPAGDLTFSGPVDLGGSARRFSGSSSLITFSNVISNGTLTLDGGRWAMLGENTFVGGLTLENSGWLDIAEDRSLGGVGATFTLLTSTLHPIASVVIRRPIELQGFNSIVVDTDQTTILEGPVTGSSGVLFKAGGGTLTFRGDTQQFGGMAVQAGTLRLENTGAPSPGIFVHPSGTLSGNGRASLVVVNAGAHLAPGAETPGELSIRFLQIDPGAILDFDLGVAAFDLIRIVNDSVHVVPGDPVIVNLADAGGLANDQIYTLIDFSAATGISDITASDFFLGTSPVQGTFSIAENTLLFTTVPEPSLGILVLASLPLLQGRRRLRVNT